MIIDSYEVGISKPNLEIFKLALSEAKCLPIEAVMIGDRIDNDIIPALSLGMKTIWIKQSFGGLGDISLLNLKPDFIIDRIEDILSLNIDAE